MSSLKKERQKEEFVRQGEVDLAHYIDFLFTVLHHCLNILVPALRRRSPSCLDVRRNLPGRHISNGVYTLFPSCPGTARELYCDMTTDGGNHNFYQENQMKQTL